MAFSFPIFPSLRTRIYLSQIVEASSHPFPRPRSRPVLRPWLSWAEQLPALMKALPKEPPPSLQPLTDPYDLLLLSPDSQAPFSVLPTTTPPPTSRPFPASTRVLTCRLCRHAYEAVGLLERARECPPDNRGRKAKVLDFNAIPLTLILTSVAAVADGSPYVPSNSPPLLP